RSGNGSLARPGDDSRHVLAASPARARQPGRTPLDARTTARTAGGGRRGRGPGRGVYACGGGAPARTVRRGRAPPDRREDGGGRSELPLRPRRRRGRAVARTARLPGPSRAAPRGCVVVTDPHAPARRGRRGGGAAARPAGGARRPGRAR